MENISSNVTVEQEEGIKEWDLGVVVSMRILASLIVVLNGTVLICLRRVKHDIPEIYALQITILCFSDLLSGFSTAVSSVLDAAWFREDVFRCSAALVFFMSTQATTLYEVMAIGINRFVILIRMEKVAQHLTKGRVILISVIAVLSNIVLCSLPYILFLPSQDNTTGGVTECSPEVVFRGNIKEPFTLYLVVFLAPLIVTNILYSVIFVILNCKRRRRQSMARSGTIKVRNIASLREISIHESESTECQSGSDPTPVIPSLASCATHAAWDVTDQQDGHLAAGREGLSAGSNLHSGREDGQSCRPISFKALPSSIATIEIVSSAPTPSSRQTKPGSFRSKVPAPSHETRAFKLIGLVLLFLNVFTWAPLFVLYYVKDLSMATNAGVFSLISFNSLVNPILYTIQITEFRKAVVKMLLGVISRVRSR